MSYGGIGAIHKMVKRIGLDKEIDNRLELLKVHLPYHESDHVLNLAYNALVGGMRLEDIELRRNDESFMDAIGAQRIPDPTTAGDFTRRFETKDTVLLMDCINSARKRVWSKAPRGLMEEACIDVDGSLAATLGECKQGMDISYKGIWGYHPQPSPHFQTTEKASEKVRWLSNSSPKRCMRGRRRCSGILGAKS